MKHCTLTDLYNRSSKHSHYQILARPLQAIIAQDGLKTIPRYETERLHYILMRCPVKGRVIIDVGGNTGYFTFECATQGASAVLYFEGNEVHTEFVKEAVRVLHLDRVVSVSAKYLNFKNDLDYQVDICLLLNVLHHIGDDYGDVTMSRDEVKQTVIESLNYLSLKTKDLIFQLGFNWKGDRDLPLFQGGTKTEMIDFIRKGTIHHWEIQHIGIAQREESGIIYRDLDETNIKRDDSMGEFLNRPLFIMRSKNL